MSTHAVIIATAKVRPGTDEEFSVWKSHHDQVIGKFAGFVSSDILPPVHEGSNEWTIILTFRSKEDLTVWQRSPERAAVVGEAVPLLVGGTMGEVVQIGDQGVRSDSNVTEVIFSKIKPGREDAYRAWSARIQAEQAKYPGYQGMFHQHPEEKGGLWTTIIRFDSAPHLEAWMNAPERKVLVREAEEFVEHEQFTRLATSFPGWVPIDPKTGKGPPNWKTSLLVLLGLFPIVMLEMRFLSPVLGGMGLHASLATFIGNAISVFLTSFLTMPLFVRWFGWWLFTDEDTTGQATLKGNAILAVLFAIEVAAFWHLLPW